MRQGLALIGIVTILSFATVLFGAALPINAQTPYSINALKTYNLPADTATAPTLGTNKFDCQNTNFVTRPVKFNGSIVLQPEIQQTVCAYSTAYGWYGNNYLKVVGTSVAGKLKSQMSTSSVLMPIPNSTKLLEFVGAGGYAHRVYVYENYLPGLMVQKSSTGEITYTLPVPKVLLKDSTNRELFVDWNSARVSNNGEWLVADGLAQSGFVRVNLTDYSAYAFTYNYSTGSRVNNTFNAVSNDGQQIVIANSSPTPTLKLFTIGLCTKTTVTIQNCPSTNLLEEAKKLQPSLYYVAHHPRFTTTNKLQFYAVHDYSINNSKLSLFDFSFGTNTNTKVEYLALGDSFASGEGAYSYKLGTDIADNRCHTSVKSYGYLLYAEASGIGSFESVACSGAKINDVVLGNILEVDYNRNDAQAKNKVHDTYDNEILSGFLPGYRYQNRFSHENKQLISTLSIGGNDIGFADIIQKCVLSVASGCFDSYEERKGIANTILAQRERLVKTYTEVKDSMAENGRLYVVGYPQIADPNGNCAANVHFTKQEIIFGAQLISYLNKVIKSAAAEAAVFYVDTEHAFDGHKMCETQSYNVAVNGLTFGNGGPINGVGPLAKESYHPNTLGHELFAKTIREQTAGLTAAMPQKSSNQTLPDDSDPFLASAPKENTTVSAYVYLQNLTADLVFRGSNLTLNPIVTSQLAPKVSSLFDVILHSDPITLGTIQSDANGVISGTVTLPDNIELGYHTLIVNGQNILGEPIQIQKYIYVAASETDYDGDGIANTNEPCVLLPTSGQDADKDGLDDACDAYIAPAPPEPEPTPTPTPDPIQPTEPPQSTENPQDANTTPPGNDTTIKEEIIAYILQEKDPPTFDNPLVPTPQTVAVVAVSNTSGSVVAQQGDANRTQTATQQPKNNDTIQTPITTVAGITTPTEETSKNSFVVWVVIFVSTVGLAVLLFVLVKKVDRQS